MGSHPHHEEVTWSVVPHLLPSPEPARGVAGIPGSHQAKSLRCGAPKVGWCPMNSRIYEVYLSQSSSYWSGKPTWLSLGAQHCSDFPFPISTNWLKGSMATVSGSNSAFKNTSCLIGFTTVYGSEESPITPVV